MSKLNVNEIEATSTDTNVKILTKGTDGSCEIKSATNDATLQLNCSAQSHGVKLKTPNNTAGQNYTMILPDNQIAANKLLKVKSVTGSGASAVGQLEYADAPSQDISSLNASNLTSGTVPAARLPSFTGAQGAALVLVDEQTVGSTDVASITFTGIEDDTMYKIVAPNINHSATGGVYMEWLDSSGNAQTWIRTEQYHYYSNSYPDYTFSLQDSKIKLFGRYTEANHVFVGDISNKAANNWALFWGFSPDDYDGSNFECYSTFRSNESTKRIHGIKIVNHSSYLFSEGTKILLYKYRES